MKRKNSINLLCFALLALAFGSVSCDDWTETEGIGKNVSRPSEQDPALWAQYTAALREYKKSDHFLTYARLHNSPEAASSEKDFMRCLPDSLDIVSLTNADRFSTFDLEDLFVMREKGTRVLYQVDYAARAAELADPAALGAYLDSVIAAVKGNRLDGYSFTGTPRSGDAATAAAAALIVEKLAGAKEEGQLIVFEGNPLFVAAADRAKVDYFVLDTETTDNVTDLRMQVLGATGYAAVPQEKLLLAAAAGSPLFTEDRTEMAAITEMTARVVSFGPLAGLGVYNIGEDYYDAKMNYPLVRGAIQTLNPSK
ncbi:glycoside hydrolase family 18 [Alistipes sp.]|uniref:glycoside hydrolase family 18 n=1 Tax=Alistipes sp. TaxID=1872444 RepID=UPI003AF078B7